MTLRLALPFALASAVAVGCSDPVGVPDDDGARCVLDSQCALGQICVDGACVADPDVARCTRNDDCDDGLVCRDGDCLEPAEGGECAGSDECGRTEYCTTDDDACLPSVECVNSEPGAGCDEGCYGHCVPRPSCTSDDDCTPTEGCDPSAFVCVPLGDCSTDADCDVHASCIGETCTQNGDCSVDDECAPNQSCVAGRCDRNGTCSIDSDCPDDQRCLDAVCTRRAACVVDDECAFDELCDLGNDGGTCTFIGSCTDVDDCPNQPGIACLDGVCTRAPCGRDSDCDNGLFCDGKETCNPREGCADGPDPRTEDLPSCVDEVCDEDSDQLVLTPVNARCADATPCTDDVCDVGLGCLHPANDFQPDPGPVGDCQQTVCRDGALIAIPADGETPLDPGPVDDCRRAVCQGGARFLVVDDSETPPQGPSNDCVREVCQGGAVHTVPNDSELPPQGPANDCVREICQGGAPTTTSADAEVPPQGSANDCVREICQGGRAVDIPNDDEVPPQGPTNDCVREVCHVGAVIDVANDGETPPQRSATDCTTQVCSGGAVVDVANDGEIPPQVSATDCKRQTCSGGTVVAVNDDSEVPADLGCRDGVCSNGTPTTVDNDGNCVDTAVCTVGNCNVDGTCSQVENDALCACGAGRVGLCEPSDPRAATSGSLAGCVCLTPATLTCGLDDGDFQKRMLERFDLFASAPGAQPGSTFVWDLVGTPAGADPAAQLLGNATSATNAFFQATTPSAPGVRDYVLRVTLQEPNLPAQTCEVRVEAQKIPDTLEITLFMQDPLDVDLHVIGGVGASSFDMPFHALHNPSFGDDPNRDCYWENCQVCSVHVPGQEPCTANPRVVDFDDPADGAALTDKQDPQLDIDNQRGCFTNTNGDLTCIPEKTTVELPDAGTYRVFAYLWGDALATSPGLASTPSTTTVTLEIKCRDQTQTVTKTLSSVTADGAVAAANDPVRYDDSAVFITVPTTGACTITP